VLVHTDGEWRNFADPSPWAVEGDNEYTGFYEDRVSFLLDDGSVEGFGEFGGWLTAHERMRSLPGEVPESEVRGHEHFGADGVWEDGTWTVEMWRDLRTGHPADTKQLEPGGVYTWTPAVHHGAGQRWHWVAYPYELGLGVEPEYAGDRHTAGTTELVATEFTGETPDEDTVASVRRRPRTPCRTRGSSRCRRRRSRRRRRTRPRDSRSPRDSRRARRWG